MAVEIIIYQPIGIDGVILAIGLRDALGNIAPIKAFPSWDSARAYAYQEISVGKNILKYCDENEKKGLTAIPPCVLNAFSTNDKQIYQIVEQTIVHLIKWLLAHNCDQSQSNLILSIGDWQLVRKLIPKTH